MVGDFPWFRTRVLQPPRRREEAAVLSSSGDRYDVQQPAQPIDVLHREAPRRETMEHIIEPIQHYQSHSPNYGDTPSASTQMRSQIRKAGPGSTGPVQRRNQMNAIAQLLGRSAS